MHVDRLFAIWVRTMPPDRLDDLSARKRLPAMVGQVKQQAKFGGGQVNRRALTNCLACVLIEH